MRYLFMLLLLVGYCRALQAQPMLQRLSSQEYQSFQKEGHEYSDGVVKLKDKFYYITLSPVNAQKGRRREGNVSLMGTSTRHTLYETDGTPKGTRIALENTEGFYNLGATRDALLYYTYTPLYGTLHRYRPGSGNEILSTAYKLNGISRVSKIYTEPDKADAMMFHFESNTYYLLYLSAEGKLRVIRSAPYIEPAKMQFLEFAVSSKPVWTEQGIKITGSKRRPDRTFATSIRFLDFQEGSKLLSWNYDRLDPIGRIASSFFYLDGLPSILMSLVDSATGQKKLKVMTIKGETGNTSIIPLRKDVGNFWYSEVKRDKVVIFYERYIGIFLMNSKQIQHLNGGLQVTDFFNNTDKALLTDEFIFYTSGDTLIYQRYDGEELDKPDAGLQKLIVKRQTHFPDQSPNGVPTRGATTKRYFYYIAPDKTLYRFNPYSSKNPHMAVALPPDTKIKEWRLMQSCEDAVFVGAVVEGKRKQDKFEVFVLRDADN